MDNNHYKQSLPTENPGHIPVDQNFRGSNPTFQSGISPARDNQSHADRSLVLVRNLNDPLTVEEIHCEKSVARSKTNYSEEHWSSEIRSLGIRKPPKFIKVIQAYRVLASDKLTLNVEVSSKFPVIFEWTVNDAKVIKDSKRYICKHGLNVSSLTVQRPIEGTIGCEARSGAFIARTYGYVKVDTDVQKHKKYLPFTKSFSVSEDMSENSSLRGTPVLPPRFINQIPNLIVDQGSEAVIDVEVESFTSSSFAWYFNGKEFDETNTNYEIYYPSENRCLLLIKMPAEGIFTVKASNDAGSVISEGFMEIISKQSSQRSRMDLLSPDTFESRSHSLPGNSVQQKYETASHSPACTEIIETGFIISDYEERTQSPERRTQTPVKRFYQPKLKQLAPVFTTELESETICVSNEKLLLDVEVSAIPAANFSWDVNGFEIKKNKTFELIDGDNRSTLVLHPPIRLGRYRVKSFNAHGESTSITVVKICDANVEETNKEYIFPTESTQFDNIEKEEFKLLPIPVSHIIRTNSPSNIISQPLPQKPVLIQNNTASEIYVKKGESLILEMKVDSCPKSAFKWYHKNFEIKPSPIISIETPNINHSIAIFQQPFSGAYKCIAVNPYGSETMETRVTSEYVEDIEIGSLVRKKDTKNELEKKSEVEYTLPANKLNITKKMNLPKAPIIVEKLPKSLKVNEDDSFELYIKCEAVPPVTTFVWRHNHFELKNSKKYTIRNSSNESRISIAKPSEGVISVKAINQMGDDTSECKVHLIYNEEPLKPVLRVQKFIHSLEGINALSIDNQTRQQILLVSVDAEYGAFKWFVNDKEIVVGDYYDIVSQQNWSKLFIKREFNTPVVFEAQFTNPIGQLATKSLPMMLTNKSYELEKHTVKKVTEILQIEQIDECIILPHISEEHNNIEIVKEAKFEKKEDVHKFVEPIEVQELVNIERAGKLVEKTVQQLKQKSVTPPPVLPKTIQTCIIPPEPYFLQSLEKLKNITINRNQPFTKLNVHVESVIIGSIVWFKDGVDLEAGCKNDEYQIIDESLLSSTLVLKTDQIKEGSIYGAQFVTKFGTLTTTTQQITLSHLRPLLFIKSLDNVEEIIFDEKEKETKFNVVVDTNIEGSFKWFLNGSPVSQDNSTIDSNGIESTLTLKTFVPSGTVIAVEFTNSQGVLFSRTFELNVNILRETEIVAPTFINHWQKFVVNENDDFGCEAVVCKEAGDCIFIWFLNNNPIHSKFITSDSHCSKLFIPNISLEMAGELMVVCENEKGVVEMKEQFEVTKFVLQIPKIKKTLKRKSTVEEQVAESIMQDIPYFEPYDNSDDETSNFDIQNSQIFAQPSPLSKSENIEFTEIYKEPENYSLLVKVAESIATTLVARIFVDAMKESASVLVDRNKKSVRDIKNAYDYETDNEDLLMVQVVNNTVHSPPHFEVDSERYTVSEGQNIAIHTLIHGFPNPGSLWYHEGNLLSQSNQHIIITTNGHSQLIIKNVKRGIDSGTYKCVGSNLLGTATYTCLLEIIEKSPEAEIHNIVTQISVPVAEGDVSDDQKSEYVEMNVHMLGVQTNLCDFGNEIDSNRSSAMCSPIDRRDDLAFFTDSKQSPNIETINSTECQLLFVKKDSNVFLEHVVGLTESDDNSTQNENMVKPAHKDNVAESTQNINNVECDLLFKKCNQNDHIEHFINLEESGVDLVFNKLNEDHFVEQNLVDNPIQKSEIANCDLLFKQKEDYDSVEYSIDHIGMLKSESHKEELTGCDLLFKKPSESVEAIDNLPKEELTGCDLLFVKQFTEEICEYIIKIFNITNLDKRIPHIKSTEGCNLYFSRKNEEEGVDVICEIDEHLKVVNDTLKNKLTPIDPILEKVDFSEIILSAEKKQVKQSAKLKYFNKNFESASDTESEHLVPLKLEETQCNVVIDNSSQESLFEIIIEIATTMEELFDTREQRIKIIESSIEESKLVWKSPERENSDTIKLTRKRFYSIESVSDSEILDVKSVGTQIQNFITISKPEEEFTESVIILHDDLESPVNLGLIEFLDARDHSTIDDLSYATAVEETETKLVWESQANKEKSPVKRITLPKLKSPTPFSDSESDSFECIKPLILITDELNEESAVNINLPYSPIQTSTILNDLNSFESASVNIIKVDDEFEYILIVDQEAFESDEAFFSGIKKKLTDVMNGTDISKDISPDEHVTIVVNITKEGDQEIHEVNIIRDDISFTDKIAFGKNINNEVLQTKFIEIVDQNSANNFNKEICIMKNTSVLIALAGNESFEHAQEIILKSYEKESLVSPNLFPIECIEIIIAAKSNHLLQNNLRLAAENPVLDEYVAIDITKDNTFEYQLTIVETQQFALKSDLIIGSELCEQIVSIAGTFVNEIRNAEVIAQIKSPNVIYDCSSYVLLQTHSEQETKAKDVWKLTKRSEHSPSICEETSVEDKELFSKVLENISIRPRTNSNATEFIDGEENSLASTSVSLYPGSQRPVFVQNLKDLTIPLNEQLKLKAIISSSPLAFVTFKLNGILLQNNDSNVTIIVEDGIAILTIAKATKDFEGQYLCVGENICGIAESTCNVSITDIASYSMVLGTTELNSTLTLSQTQIQDVKSKEECQSSSISFKSVSGNPTKDDSKKEIEFIDCSENVTDPLKQLVHLNERKVSIVSIDADLTCTENNSSTCFVTINSLSEKEKLKYSFVTKKLDKLAFNMEQILRVTKKYFPKRSEDSGQSSRSSSTVPHLEIDKKHKNSIKNILSTFAIKKESAPSTPVPTQFSEVEEEFVIHRYPDTEYLENQFVRTNNYAECFLDIHDQLPKDGDVIKQKIENLQKEKGLILISPSPTPDQNSLLSSMVASKNNDLDNRGSLASPEVAFDGQTGKCPWLLVGVVATSVWPKDEILDDTQAHEGNAFVLSKPISDQLTTNAYKWLKINRQHIEDLRIEETNKQDCEQMCGLNRNAAILAKKCETSSPTDATRNFFPPHNDSPTIGLIEEMTEDSREENVPGCGRNSVTLVKSSPLPTLISSQKLSSDDLVIEETQNIECENIAQVDQEWLIEKEHLYGVTEITWKEEYINDQNPLRRTASTPPLPSQSSPSFKTKPLNSLFRNIKKSLISSKSTIKRHLPSPSHFLHKTSSTPTKFSSIEADEIEKAIIEAARKISKNEPVSKADAEVRDELTKANLEKAILDSSKTDMIPPRPSHAKKVVANKLLPEANIYDDPLEIDDDILKFKDPIQQLRLGLKNIQKEFVDNEEEQIKLELSNLAQHMESNRNTVERNHTNERIDSLKSRSETLARMTPLIGVVKEKLSNLEDTVNYKVIEARRHHGRVTPYDGKEMIHELLVKINNEINNIYDLCRKRKGTKNLATIVHVLNNVCAYIDVITSKLNIIDVLSESQNGLWTPNQTPVNVLRTELVKKQEDPKLIGEMEQLYKEYLDLGSVNVKVTCNVRKKEENEEILVILKPLNFDNDKHLYKEEFDISIYDDSCRELIPPCTKPISQPNGTEVVELDVVSPLPPNHCGILRQLSKVSTMSLSLTDLNHESLSSCGSSETGSIIMMNSIAVANQMPNVINASFELSNFGKSVNEKVATVISLNNLRVKLRQDLFDERCSMQMVCEESEYGTDTEGGSKIKQGSPFKKVNPMETITEPTPSSTNATMQDDGLKEILLVAHNMNLPLASKADELNNEEINHVYDDEKDDVSEQNNFDENELITDIELKVILKKKGRIDIKKRNDSRLESDHSPHNSDLSHEEMSITKNIHVNLAARVFKNLNTPENMVEVSVHQVIEPSLGKWNNEFVNTTIGIVEDNDAINYVSAINLVADTIESPKNDYKFVSLNLTNKYKKDADNKLKEVIVTDEIVKVEEHSEEDSNSDSMFSNNLARLNVSIVAKALADVCFVNVEELEFKEVFFNICSDGVLSESYKAMDESMYKSYDSRENAPFSVMVTERNMEEGGKSMISQPSSNHGSVKSLYVSHEGTPTNSQMTIPTYVIKKGSTASITCELNNSFNRQTDIAWFKGKQRIKLVSPKYSRISHDLLEVLIISTVEDDDADIYSLEVTNEVFPVAYLAIDEAMTESILSVPKFISPPQTLFVMNGHPATISCQLDQTPDNLSWFRDRKQIQITDRIRFESDPHTNIYKIIFSQITLLDQGTYYAFCGNVSTLTNVVVEEQISEKEIPVSSNDDDESNFAEYIVPLNSTATIACELETYEYVKNFEWLKNGLSINLKNETKIEHVINHLKHYLIIHNTEEADSGLYSVRINGTIFRVAQIIISEFDDENSLGTVAKRKRISTHSLASTEFNGENQNYDSDEDLI